MKLLYAEDEAGMSEAVTDILTYHKYIVDTVADGEEALAYAQAEKYSGYYDAEVKRAGSAAAAAECGVPNSGAAADCKG